MWQIVKRSIRRRLKKPVDFNKLCWAARGLACKLSFGHFGSWSYIGKPVSVRGRRNIFVMDRVRIYPGARMEAAGNGRIIIGRNTSIGQNLHITAAGEDLAIGKNTTITGNVCITNIDHNYRKVGRHILDQEQLISATKIGDNCFIGYGAVIQAGTVLGKQCVVGANAVVRGVFPDYCVIAGVPARIIKQYSPKTGSWENVSTALRKSLH